MRHALGRHTAGLLAAFATVAVCSGAGGAAAEEEEPDPSELLLGPKPIEAARGEGGGDGAGEGVQGPEATGKATAAELLERAARALAAEGASAEARAHAELARGRVAEALKLLERRKGSRADARRTVLRALALIRAGEAGEASGLLREAAALIESKGSLALRELGFADRIISFGNWDRAKAVFRPSQRVMTYCEVVGFACVRHAAEDYAVRLKMSIGIDRDDGSHFIETLRKDTVEHKTRSRIHDLHLCTRLDLPGGIPPGKYVLRVVVSDRATGASSTTGVAFEVVAGGGGGGGGGTK